jgi:hypothetical protein
MDVEEFLPEGDITEEESINTDEAGASLKQDSSSSEELHTDDVNSLESARRYVKENAYFITEALLSVDEHCSAQHEDRLYFYQQLCDNIHDFKESEKEISRIHLAAFHKRLQDPEFSKLLTESCLKHTRSSRQIFQTIHEHLTVAGWNDLKSSSRSNQWK